MRLQYDIYPQPESKFYYIRILLPNGQVLRKSGETTKKRAKMVAENLSKELMDKLNCEAFWNDIC